MNGQFPETLEPATAWAKDAACLGYELNEFFTKDRRRVQQAKNVCARCPVRPECLDEALRAEDGARYGIFGGLTAAERADLARQQ